MAVFVPPLIGGAAAGAAMYQAYNPPKKQAPESRGNPRNAQDWRLTPQEDIRRIPDYWRNHVNRPSQPIEDAYRSTYNNIYTNGPKMVRDALTGEIRWITPDGNSTNDGARRCFYPPNPRSHHRPPRFWPGACPSARGQPQRA